MPATIRHMYINPVAAEVGTQRTTSAHWNQDHSVTINVDLNSEVSGLLPAENGGFTTEQVDDRVAALIQNGVSLTWSYDDTLNTLTGNLPQSIAINATPTFDGLTLSASNKTIVFGASQGNRKIELYRTTDSDNDFYGFGINAATLRYQVDRSTSSHVWYSGIDSATSRELMRTTGNGNIVCGGNNAAALATNATSGFFYIPTCNGTPTGTPTAFAGRVPMIYDTSLNRLFIYNGAWRSTVLS